MPQESIHEFYEMVRAEKKAAFEIKAEKWYKITIEATIRPGERKTFYTYDVPDSFLNKYDWVFRWRRAKIQCLYPKLHSIFALITKRKGCCLNIITAYYPNTLQQKQGLLVSRKRLTSICLVSKTVYFSIRTKTNSFRRFQENYKVQKQCLHKWKNK